MQTLFHGVGTIRAVQSRVFDAFAKGSTRMDSEPTPLPDEHGGTQTIHSSLTPQSHEPPGLEPGQGKLGLRRLVRPRPVGSAHRLSALPVSVLRRMYSWHAPPTEPSRW